MFFHADIQRTYLEYQRMFAEQLGEEFNTPSMPLQCETHPDHTEKATFFENPLMATVNSVE